MFVQDRAAAGHADIQTHSTLFRVVGCTEDTDARDNTVTTHTGSDKGVPIYWLDGNKAADDYEDFYDGDWDDEANDKNETGTDGPDTSMANNYPFTGCEHDGTAAFHSGDLRRPRRRRTGAGGPSQLHRLPATDPSAAISAQVPAVPGRSTGFLRSSPSPGTLSSATPAKATILPPSCSLTTRRGSPPVPTPAATP